MPACEVRKLPGYNYKFYGHIDGCKRLASIKQSLSQVEQVVLARMPAHVVVWPLSPVRLMSYREHFT